VKLIIKGNGLDRAHGLNTSYMELLRKNGDSSKFRHGDSKPVFSCEEEHEEWLDLLKEPIKFSGKLRLNYE